MGATYTRIGTKSWRIVVHHKGKRQYATVHSEADAKALVRFIYQQEMAGIAVTESIRAAREPLAVQPLTYPMLKVALPQWIEGQVAAGEIRASTAKSYRGRCAKWLYRHELRDGRLLGELPVNQVTREQLGAVIRKIKEAGRSLAGLRWGESGALVRSDIDWSRGRLHVQRTISGRGSVAPPKNGRDRWDKASPALLKALRSHLEAIDLDGSIEDWSPEQRQLVFPTSGGNTVRYPYFHERVWKPLLTRAKLPYRKYHATRHSYATWLLDASADIRWVQAQLGHASISQTVDTYGHIQVERHEHVVEVLDRQLKSG